MTCSYRPQNATLDQGPPVVVIMAREAALRCHFPVSLYFARFGEWRLTSWTFVSCDGCRWTDLSHGMDGTLLFPTTFAIFRALAQKAA